MPGWLNPPEVAALFKELLVIGESNRGAVLVGGAHVDRHLRLLFEATLPADLSMRRRHELLSYPGPLSTFSARIELAYGGRFIGRILYDALHAFRKIRNDVAHNPGTFRLRGQEERLRHIYTLGPGMKEEIPRLAAQMMAQAKLETALEHERQRLEAAPDSEPLFASREEAVELMRSDADIMEAFRDEVPQWGVAVAITLICGNIVRQRERLTELLGPDRLLNQLRPTDGVSSGGGGWRLVPVSDESRKLVDLIRRKSPAPAGRAGSSSS